MKLIMRPVITALALFAASASSQATIVVNFGGRTIADQFGTALGPETLLQFVDLGANGVFDPISIGDGSTDGLSRWVSGDDTVINVAFLDTQDTPDTTFPTTKAFDFGSGTTPAGRFGWSMEFQDGVIPAGTKFGIRWFAGLAATNFDNITLQEGQKYGQFSRQGASLYGGDLWVWPTYDPQQVSPVITLDGLRTTNNAGGLDPITEGQALLSVVPEPSSLALALVGAFGIFGLRRRRS
jgi:hypothetical protein